MSGDEPGPEGKFRRLLEALKEAESAALAFSGGVDSTFLLKAMKFSGISTIAVTGVSETMPEGDLVRARNFAGQLGIEHVIIRTEELADERFAGNPPERCFYCKDGLFAKIRAMAGERGFRAVFDGTNADDLSDYRPGRRAAELHGVRSPLAECGLAKKEVRILSKELGLEAWDRPASPCLSSRFPYGRRITPEGLARVRDAEDFIRALGVGDLRVRDHGDTARIEVCEEDMEILMAPENRRAVALRLKELGYSFVSLDLEGYRSGSLNRVLDAADSRVHNPS